MEKARKAEKLRLDFEAKTLLLTLYHLKFEN